MTLAKGWGKNSIHSAVGQISTFGFTCLLCNCSEIQLYRERQCTLYVCIISAFLLKVAYTCFIPDKKALYFQKRSWFWVSSFCWRTFYKAMLNNLQMWTKFPVFGTQRAKSETHFSASDSFERKAYGLPVLLSLCPIAKEIFNLCDTAVGGRWDTVVSTRGGGAWTPSFWSCLGEIKPN